MKPSSYQAKTPDHQGVIHYTEAEHAVWHDLYQAQLPHVRAGMCKEYNDGLDYLQLSANQIPQCPALSKQLKAATGWQVKPVPALIGFKTFFGMLSEQTFPAASFIRRRDEFEYLKEPDIFHEIFGHVPLLTNQAFAQFTQRIGRLGSQLPKSYHVWLIRIYWMTVEFGLTQTAQGLRAYGAGLASSTAELQHALHSEQPLRQPFDFLEVLRTGYRIDIMQPIYYVIDDFVVLLEASDTQLVTLIEQAMQLGLFAPHYPEKEVA